MNDAKKTLLDLGRQVIACYKQKKATLDCLSSMRHGFLDIGEQGTPSECAKELHSQIKLFNKSQEELKSNIIEAQKLTIQENLNDPDVVLAVWFLRWYESEVKVQDIKKTLYLEEFAHIVYENYLSEDFLKEFEPDVTLADDGVFNDTIKQLHEALLKKEELQKKVQDLIEKY